MSNHNELEKAVEKYNIGGYRRHVFLCTGPSCCSAEEGSQAWDALKQAIKDADLGDSCFRTKVGCLRVCRAGPIGVVYPEGTWYQSLSAQNIQQFVKDHLVEGKPVEEWVFARNPLEPLPEPAPRREKSPS